MVVGTMVLTLAIYDSASLKDKRGAVKSLKERLKNRFNASVAEVGALDHRQRAELGVAVVGNDARFVRRVMDKMVDYVRQDHGVALIDYEVDVY